MSINYWTKDIQRWIESDEEPLSITPRKIIKKSIPSQNKPQRYYVNERHPKIYLTPRELEISAFLIHHYRYKSIGHHLSLSPRSIEFYIYNLRLKFHCKDKKSLIAILKKIEIVKNFDIRDKPN